MPQLSDVHWGWFRQRLDWRANDFFRARDRRENREVSIEEIRERRGDSNNIELDRSDLSSDPEEQVERNEIRSAVRKAVDKLSTPWDRTIAELYAYGYTSKEIGEEVGRSADWVRQRFKRNIKPFLARELQYAVLFNSQALSGQ